MLVVFFSTGIVLVVFLTLSQCWYSASVPHGTGIVLVMFLGVLDQWYYGIGKMVVCSGHCSLSFCDLHCFVSSLYNLYAKCMR